MPRDQYNFIGMGFNLRHFYVFDDDELARSNVFYSNVNVSAGYRIFHNFQLTLSVPYFYNVHASASSTESYSNTIQGIGDIALGAVYVLYSNKNDKDARVRSHLSASLDVELPTGKFNNNYLEDDLPAAMSTGSQSFDFQGGLQYAGQIKKWGLRAFTSYKVNTYNTYNFKFGDQFSFAGYFYRQCKIKKTGISPFAGVSYWNIANDKRGNEVQTGIGGQSIDGALGVECSTRHLNFGANVLLPINKQFNAAGIETRLDGSVYLSYLF